MWVRKMLSDLNQRFRRAFCSTLICFVAVTLSATGCGRDTEVPSHRYPLELVGSDIDDAIHSIPSKIGLSFSGVSFYRESLYVTSNVGVFEVKNGKQVRLFKWFPKDDVVSGPWVDRSANRLWAFHAGLAKFLNFDGEGWQTIEFPIAEPSRGDLLFGYNGLTNKNGFWIQAQTYAGWEWHSESNSWSLIDIPKVRCRDYGDGTDTYSCLASIAPTDQNAFVIMHQEFIGPMADLKSSKAERPMPDRVFFKRGADWIEVKPTDDRDFVTKSVVTTPKYAYIQSHFGPFFRLDETGIQRIEPPGDVEAMAGTSESNLLVSVRNVGIFEYQSGWVKKFAAPYLPGYPVQFAYLTENSGRIALAVMLESGRRSPEGFRSRVWTSDGDKLAEIAMSSRKESANP